MAASNSDIRPTVGTVTVNVIAGRNLVPKDKNGFSDPYVIVRVDSAEQRTAVVKKTLNPVYEEEVFTFPVHSMDSIIHLTVWDRDKIGSDDFMGHADVPVRDLPSVGKYMRDWITLLPRKAETVTGDIEVMCCFEEDSGVNKRMRVVDYLGPEPEFLGSLPELVDPKREMLVSEPLDMVMPAGDPFGAYLDAPHLEQNWYNRFFVPHNHDVFLAKHADIRGVVAVAVMTTEVPFMGTQYWVVVFSSRDVLHYCVDEPVGNTLSFPELLTRVDPKLAKHAKAFTKVSHVDKLVRDLARIEDPEPDDRIKIGVLFARDGQTDDDAMFSNIDGSPAFEEFLDLLGERVRLNGFTGYSAQLDTQNDGSGLYSVYREDFCNYEIMFHVSTLLQYDETDPQRVQRKRFIGNDIVVIVFMDGETVYSVDTMKSQYTRVLFVVQPDPDNDAQYRVSTAYAKDVRDFGPEDYYYYPKDETFVQHLLAKCINGEKATKASPEFVVRERRTRQQYLELLHEEHASLGKKDATLQTESHPMLAIQMQDPQVFAFGQILDGIPGKINCFTTHDTRNFFGTATGLYYVDDGSVEITRALELANVEQIQTMPEQNTMFVRTSDPPRMFAFTLADLLNGVDPVTTLIPCTDPSLFCCGNVNGLSYLSVGSREAVYVYAVNHDAQDNIVILESLHLPADVTALTAVGEGIVVGSSSISTATFTFYKFPDFAPTVLHAGADDDMCVAAFALRNGIILCYDTHGVLLDRNGRIRPESVFHWVGTPVAFAMRDSFLIVFYASFVTVLSALSGCVVETHKIATPSSFVTDTRSDAVLMPFWNPTSNESVVYKCDTL